MRAVRLAENTKNAAAYLLADHLDAMLAVGEDLLKVHRVVFAEVPKPRPESVRDLVEVQRRCIDAMRTLEMSLTLRGLQARERADELLRLTISLRKLLPSGRFHEIQNWPLGDDAGRVDGAVALVIVALDMRHVHGLGDAGHLIEVAQVA